MLEALGQWGLSKKRIGDESGLALVEIKEIPRVVRSRFPAIFATGREHGPGYLRRDKRFGLKIKVLSWGTFFVSRGNNVVTYNAISRAFLLLTSKADKLLLRMEPVSCESRNVIVFK